ncbi:DUF413 domain-containing protein [Vibrio lentus]|nr:DUF413 domain-containing protein [Vibrio lentus]
MYYNLENVEVIKILNQPFSDFKNFPRGFAKSGDFTIAQSQILESFGNALIALRDGVELTGIGLRGKKIEDLGSTPEALKAWNK